MPSIAIDGVVLDVAEGTTIVEAARAAGIRIPTLCYLKERSAIASCRVCVVDVEGLDHPVPACATPVQDGMAVTTSSPRLDAYRRVALELIVADHGLDSTNYCFSCNKNGACELQDLCREYGVLETPYEAAQKREPVRDANPFLSYDPNLCIRCQRCVGACNDAAGNHTLRTGKRGVRTLIDAPLNIRGSKKFAVDQMPADQVAPPAHSVDTARTVAVISCGTCAQACPTGALTEKRRATYRSWETERVRTTCPHCGVGCQLDLVVKDGRIVDADGADGPSNKGLLCVQGRAASFDFVDAPDRLTTPLVRNPESGEFEPATWDEALDLVARRFAELRDEHGGEALAAFACSRSTNEDIYLFQKMARTALQTNNVDCCARV